MITILWFLIKESGGDVIFGYVSIVATLIMFLLSPLIGQSIDRFSRKSLLLRIPFKKQMLEGAHVMKGRQKLFWFLLAIYMSFIGVMMTNYLIPIYISDVLKVNASVYTIKRMMYGIGAVLAGISMPFLMKYVKTEISIVITMCIYVISITGMIVESSVVMLYGLSIFMQLEMREQGLYAMC